MFEYIKKIINPAKNDSVPFEKLNTMDDPNQIYTYDELGGIGFSSVLSENIANVKKVVWNYSDLVIRNIALGRKESKVAAVIYIDNLIDSHHIDNDIVRPLVLDAYSSGLTSSTEIINELKRGNLITRGQTQLCNNMKEFMEGLLIGGACLLIDGTQEVFTISAKGYVSRGIEESKIEPVMKGPREAFVETLSVNLGLIRKRIQSPNLAIEQIKIGTQTNTKVCIAYLKGVCPPERIYEVRTRLNRIKIDGIIESEYLEEFIQDNPFTLFPQLRNTERPDVVAASLLEGRVAIITDNTPVVLIAPGEFFSLMQSAEDYYDRYIFSTFIRFLRYFAMLIATFLPAFYIAVTNFHQEMIPTDLLISVSSARTGVPIPTLAEALAMFISFELLYEAGVRLPQNLGQTVSIVGALVIGQAAVQANVISPLMVIVVALTGIATFCIPQYNIALPSRILRFVFMILAAALGLFGLMVGILFLLLHLSSLRSFGVAYMMPLFPGDTDTFKDSIVRAPWWALVKRPSYITPNKKRMKSGQVPKPETER